MDSSGRFVRDVRLTVVIGVVAVAMLSAPEAKSKSPTRPVNVLSRAVIGNYIEDLTYIPMGSRRFGDHLAAITGYGVWVMPLTNSSQEPNDGNEEHGSIRDGHGHRPKLRKLFDFRDLGLLAGAPPGIAYVQSEGRFALVPLEPDNDTLVIVDPKGRTRETRPIQFLDPDYVPGHSEGLAYIPQDSPVFPDHLVMAVWDRNEQGTFTGSRLEVIRRDGVVVHEILPRDPVVRTGLLGAVSFLTPDRLIVGSSSGAAAEIRTLDFTGLDTAPPVSCPGKAFLEGLVQTGDGRIASTDSTSGIEMFDASLNRIPAHDTSFELGFGLAFPNGIAWNPDTKELLVRADIGNIPTGAVSNAYVSALPRSLDNARTVVDLTGFVNPQGLSYISSDHTIVVARPQGPSANRRLELFDNSGVHTGSVALVNPTPPPLILRPRGVEHLPDVDQYAVRVLEDPSHVKIFSRAGVFLRQFDPRPADVTSVGSFAFFTETAGPRLLHLMNNQRGVVTDLNGVLVREFNWQAELNLIAPMDVAAITRGHRTGTFAVVDRQLGEVVVFRMH